MGLLYTRMKIFHYREKLESLRRETEFITSPLHVRIKPINSCNHNCSYCAYRARNLQLGQDMNLQDSIPRDKMLAIVDDLAEMGVRAVTFSGGGEPFCYPYLLDTVERLAKTKIRFAALTNGSKLQGEVAEVFARHATWLRISMDGWDNASYSAYRGCPDGEFSRIIANIKAFKKLSGSCYLGVSLVVDHFNCLHILELVRILHGVGVDSIKVCPCIVSNSGTENNDYHRAIFATVKEQTTKAIESLSTPEFEIFDSYHQQLDTFAKSYHWCPNIQIAPVIGADLNIYSCQDKAYNLTHGLLGSIADVSFKEFWYSDRQRLYRIDPSVVCNHHCVKDSCNILIHEYLDADREHLAFV